MKNRRGLDWQSASVRGRQPGSPLRRILLPRESILTQQRYQISLHSVLMRTWHTGDRLSRCPSVAHIVHGTRVLASACVHPGGSWGTVAVGCSTISAGGAPRQGGTRLHPPAAVGATTCIERRWLAA